MMKSAMLPSCSSLLAVKARTDVPTVGVGSGRVSCSLRNYSNIPKLDTFSRPMSMLDRVLRDQPFIQKFETELSDYCTTLEGDECCSCWEAYFELTDLEKEIPKRDVEGLIMGASGHGMKSLIGSIHRTASIYNKRKNIAAKTKSPVVENIAAKTKSPVVENRDARICPVPDGLPKSREEIEEEEEARMPESNFTRLLRSKGTYPAWYTPAPDHETD